LLPDKERCAQRKAPAHHSRQARSARRTFYRIALSVSLVSALLPLAPALFLSFWRSFPLTSPHRRAFSLLCYDDPDVFITLVGVFAKAFIACAAAAAVDPNMCVPLSESAAKRRPSTSGQWSLGACAGSSYYKVLSAAVVAVVFAPYALMSNGLAYALTTSNPTFSNSTWTMRPFSSAITAAVALSNNGRPGAVVRHAPPARQ
jgi:hypothetical protein